MPDRPAAERTEPPTPERLRKARREGKVPTSHEVPAVLALLVLLIGLALLAPSLWQWFVRQVAEGFRLGGGGNGTLDASTLTSLVRHKGLEMIGLILPLVVTIAATSVLGSMAVGGLAFAPRAIRLNVAVLNPATGLKGLFSGKAFARLAASVLKLAAILAITWLYLRSKQDLCLNLVWAAPFGALATTMGLLFGLMARVAAALVFIALADALYQRWQYKRDLRMTRQEIKEERKQHELSPEVRGRIRAVQFERARRRMLQDVPTADVVVTNPTHVAVALSYDAATMEAPSVVAMGADRLADTIRQVARAHGVPIVSRPGLARTLYATCDVGGLVPEALYVAVAEVLAMLYRLRRRRSVEAPTRRSAAAPDGQPDD